MWGSRYFTQYPVVPLNQIITLLNADMIGRSRKEGDADPANGDLTGGDEIYVTGPRLMSTELTELSDKINNEYLRLKLNHRHDAENDPEQYFIRSDHFNYAKKGIPIIFYCDGEHEDYHQPSDTADKIDYQKLEKVTRTIFVTAWGLADVASRPRIDRRLPREPFILAP